MKLRLAMPLALAALLFGCETSIQDMAEQPKNPAYTPNTLFTDGSSARVPPAAAVPFSQGSLADSSSGRKQRIRLPAIAAHSQTPSHQAHASTEGSATESWPVAINGALMKRGQQQYEINCVPCHGYLGEGDGMVVQRGFPAPPSLHLPRLREAPTRHLVDVISNGYGAMYSYADRVKYADRWAIAAYLRALQLSQHAPATWLPKQALKAEHRRASPEASHD